MDATPIPEYGVGNADRLNALVEVVINQAVVEALVLDPPMTNDAEVIRIFEDAVVA